MIGITAIGEVDEFILKVIAAHITGYLNFKTQLLTPFEEPVYAYNYSRLQYDAGKILSNFEAVPFKPCEKVIGVLNCDIFLPVFTHVFGEARQSGTHALVSLYRLESIPGTKDHSHPLLAERAAKVALHELGHLFNLFHCQDEYCIMHFSGDLTCLDKISFHFCRSCSYTFKKNMDILGTRMRD